MFSRFILSFCQDLSFLCPIYDGLVGQQHAPMSLLTTTFASGSHLVNPLDTLLTTATFLIETTHTKSSYMLDLINENPELAGIRVPKYRRNVLQPTTRLPSPVSSESSESPLLRKKFKSGTDVDLLCVRR